MSFVAMGQSIWHNKSTNFNVSVGNDVELTIGMQLTLEPTYTDRNEKFRCKVVEMDEHIFYIDYPVNIETKKTAFLIDGAQFLVLFTSADGNASFALNSEVLGRKNDGIPMIAMKRPRAEEIVKVQRREFVRVQTRVDVSIANEHMTYQLTTEDISAGGIAAILRGHEQLEENQTVELTIVLPFENGDIHYVMTEARIVRIFEKDDVLKIASIQFVEPMDVDQQYIVRFCFERQIMLRRKELNQ